MPVAQIHPKVSEVVLSQRTEIAAALVDREFARHPEPLQRYGRIGREKSLQDACYHVAFLAQALALDNRALFIDYIAWAKVMLGQRKVLASDLVFHLEWLAEVLRERLPAETGALAAGFITSAVQAIPSMPEDMPTFLREGEPSLPDGAPVSGGIAERSAASCKSARA